MRFFEASGNRKWLLEASGTFKTVMKTLRRFQRLLVTKNDCLEATEYKMASRGIWHIQNSHDDLKKVSTASGNQNWRFRGFWQYKIASGGIWHIKNSHNDFKKVSEASGHQKWLFRGYWQYKMASRGIWHIKNSHDDLNKVSKASG